MRQNDGELSILAQRMCQLRKLSGMTQRELAEHLQLERSTYAYYETGKTTPSPETLRRLAREYRVPIDYLLGGEFSPNQTQVRQAEDALRFSLDGALGMSGCDEEERSFLSLFRQMDASMKEKLLAFGVSLLQDESDDSDSL